MSSEFDKDALDVERHYTRNVFTNFVAMRLLKHDLTHRTTYSHRLSRWLVGFANVLDSASPSDGYEWVDRRTSLFSKLHPEQQGELLKQSFKEEL